MNCEQEMAAVLAENARLRNIIRRASARFFKDGSDGETAAAMLEILREESGGSKARCVNLWELTALWIMAIKGRYAGHEPNELTQVFMRGPFAGMSERELLEMARRMDESQTKFPIKRNDNETRHDQD